MRLRSRSVLRRPVLSGTTSVSWLHTPMPRSFLMKSRSLLLWTRSFPALPDGSSRITTTICGTLGFTVRHPKRSSKGEKRLISPTSGTIWLRTKDARSPPLTVTHMSRHIRVRPDAGGLGLLCSLARHGKGFRTNGQNEVNDACALHSRRKSQRRNSGPADEACGDHCYRGRLERYRTLADGRAP